VDSALQHFRARWGALHPLSEARRWQALAMLQPLAEIQARSHHRGAGQGSFAASTRPLTSLRGSK